MLTWIRYVVALLNKKGRRSKALARDQKHIVLYEKDIEDDLKAEARRQETQKEQITFSQIAESLAANYDVIYYVDIENSSYVSYECRNNLLIPLKRL